MNTTKRIINPCTRCGKERILFKTWDDEVTTFGNRTMKITRSLNVCPDPECQKIVAAGLDAEKKKRDKLKADREEKLKERMDSKNAKKEIN